MDSSSHDDGLCSSPPPAEPPHSINDMHTDKPECEGPNAAADGDDVTKVYPIPADITDSRLEECLLQTKSTLGRLFTINVDRAARTISFTPRSPPKLIPSPALNKVGILKVTTFTVPFPKKRAKKLKEAWPAVASTLYDYSISCDLNLSECCMHVSTTPSLKDPCVIEKARHLLELLSTSLIPPSMALEIFQGVRQQETINIGFQQGGICSSSGINKDDYLKRWECLFNSLNALSKATCCHIFLDENTFTAVTAAGSSVEGISQLKTVVQDCIAKNVSPLMDDSHAKDTECLKSGPVSNKDGMLEVCSLYTLLPENRVSELQESLPKLELSLKHYGISYTLDKNYMLLSTTSGNKDPDIIDKAWQLLELLSTTHVPASLAVELLDCMHTCIIKIGYQEGGLSSLFGVKKEDYSKRLECLRHSLQILAERMECNVFLNDNTVTAVGEDPVRMVQQLVENCIRHNVCPGTVVRDYNCLSSGMINIEDPHVQHMEMDALAMTVMPEVTSFCVHFSIEQGTLVEKYWTSVEACLEKHGFSCKLVTVAEYCYCNLIVTKTIYSGELDIINKIWDFLKLLSINLDPSKAIGILNDSMDYDFVPIGYSYGGVLCTQFEVTEEEYAEKVWPRIESDLQRFSYEVNVRFVVMPGYTAVIGPKNIRAFRDFVYMCFICVRPLLSMRVRKWCD